MLTLVQPAIELTKYGLYPVRLHFPIFKEGSEVLCSCGNPKCTAQGKHPVGLEWGKGATQDEEVIRDRFGNAAWNVGIVLGICHGIPANQAVIDIEDDSPEAREFAEVLLADCPCPSYSSGKSIHRLYRWTPNLPAAANFTYKKLEFRFGGSGKETQSVAPPSIHPSGKQYEWLPGRSLEDLPITELPLHVIEWICNEWASSHSKKGSGSGSGNKKFHSDRGKLAPGERHHALLTECNKLWRMMYRLHGINGMEEDEVCEQVLMWMRGNNAVVCDPPKSDQEVAVIFNSSRSFMMKEILKEIDEKKEMEQPETADKNDEDSFGSWLHKHGIRYRPDPSLPSNSDAETRIDEWVSNWKMQYLTEGDEELIAVHFEGIEKPSIMKHPEFDKASSFARRVQQDTQGKISLNRTFPFWNWATIWSGGEISKKKPKGIVRGLREFLLNKAEVVQHVEQDLADQVEDLVYELSGPLNGIEAGIEEFLRLENKASLSGRLKMLSGGSFTTSRAPEDPNTGWYFIDDKICLVVKYSEVCKAYRRSYGNGVANRLLAEAMSSAKLGFEKKKLNVGAISGRCYLKSVKVFEE